MNPFFLKSHCRRLPWLLALVLTAGHASAGLFEDEEARRAILDLRQKLESQRLDTEKKLTEESRRLAELAAQETAVLRRAFVELQNQLEVSQADTARLRGQLEQLARDLAESQRKQKDTVQVVDERLRKLEPFKVTVDGREFLVEASEKRDYDASLAMFRKGDFANAQTGLLEFLSRYATSGYRPSALFWLGSAQYALKEYKEAVANFRVLVQSAADHVRAPEALLAIANCQVEMKDLKAAKRTLEDLLAAYPSSEAASAAKERLARMK
jgi:tol-pal system protein YbgF